MKKIKFILIFSLIVNCSHNLHIHNVEDYYSPTPSLNKKYSIGIVNSTRNKLQEKHLEDIVAAFRASGNFDVTYPATKASGKKFDYVIDISPNASYDGKGTNFLVSFPGFLIFMPYWNGYGYTANIDTKVQMNDSSNKDLGFKNHRVEYRMNHSEFDRTWTMGTDWLLTFGVLSFIGGFVYMGFDSDIENEVFRNYSPAYAKYIVNKISQDIAASN